MTSRDADGIFPRDDDPAGIYIHVPFCRTRCKYCAFVTNPFLPHLEEPYVSAVIEEIDLWQRMCGDGLRAPNWTADTLYFGGGTPSLLRPHNIARIIDRCVSSLGLVASPEITVELNPSSVRRSDLSSLKAAGVNRASLGVQSLDDRELHLLGRSHSARDAQETFEDLRSVGFDNISVDLIAGLPLQTRGDLLESLRGTIRIQPEHISIYLLEIKNDTEFHRLIRSGDLPDPDDDLAAEMYEDIRAETVAAGYEHYEISNFALDGHACRHNLKYWQDTPFLGLGPGAHGMTGRHRYANVEDLTTYMRTIKEARLPQSIFKPLTPLTRFQDAMIMGMRLTRGVDLGEIGQRYGLDAFAFVSETVSDLIDAGLIGIEGGILSLTERGHLLSNIVFARWV